jgi:alkaline phosphatase
MRPGIGNTQNACVYDTAAFAAHQPERSLENEIAVDMIRVAPDVMLSGGLRHFVPESVNNKGATYDAISDWNNGAFTVSSKRKDEVNLLTEAKDAGYQLAFTRDQMNEVLSWLRISSAFMVISFRVGSVRYLESLVAV